MVNRIGEAEQERLGLLSEEYGEGQQIVGKILRHGIDSCHPNGSETNQELLEREVGDALAAIDLLVACGTLRRRALEEHRLEKLAKLKRWLHCGTNLDAVEEMLREEERKAREANRSEAAAHAEGGCDAPNIGMSASGIMYCCHCGWNDPKGAQL